MMMELETHIMSQLDITGKHKATLLNRLRY